MQPATVRSLTQADVAQLAALEDAIFTHDAWPVAEIASYMAAPRAVGHGLEDGAGALVGYALSLYAADEAELLTIGIAPHAQGNGYGRLLLRTHLDVLKVLKMAHVFLTVRATNLPAQGLYAALGGQKVGVRRGYYPKTPKTPQEDAWIYRFDI